MENINEKVNANENSNGSIESWSSKQKEGESKARDCFN